MKHREHKILAENTFMTHKTITIMEHKTRDDVNAVKSSRCPNHLDPRIQLGVNGKEKKRKNILLTTRFGISSPEVQEMEREIG